jgi:branched-chain amino acid transport system substrate-binding protein
LSPSDFLVPITRAPEPRVQQWDGKAWKVISDWHTADDRGIESIVKEVSRKCAADRNVIARDCSKEG